MRGALADIVLFLGFAGAAAVFWPILPAAGAVLGFIALLPVADTVVNSLAYLEVDSGQIRYLDYVLRRQCATRDVKSLRIDLGLAGTLSQPKVLSLVDSSGKTLMEVSATAMPALGIAELAAMLGQRIGGSAVHLWLVGAMRRKQGEASSGDLPKDAGVTELLRRLGSKSSTGSLNLTQGPATQSVYLVRGRIVKQIGLEEGEPLPRELTISATNYRFTPSAVPQAEIDLIAGAVDEGCYRPPL